MQSSEYSLAGEEQALHHQWKPFMALLATFCSNFLYMLDIE